jgi:hypothetical protein
MESTRRLVIAALAGVGVLVLAGASDFVVGSFWSRHAMLTSLLASLVVLAVTVAVLNQWLDRRDRRRWRMLAQYVLFQLVQSARVTWTTLIEVLEQRELSADTPEQLKAVATHALETATISAAARAALADDHRRRLLRDVTHELSTHSRGVIATWASVMVGSGPFTDLFDRHVELQGRLDWLAEFLAAREPVEDKTIRDRKLLRSSVASEHAGVLASDDWLHDQLVATTQLAVRLDYESRALGFELVPMERWLQLTLAEVGDLAAFGG